MCHSNFGQNKLPDDQTEKYCTDTRNTWADLLNVWADLLVLSIDWHTYLNVCDGFLVLSTEGSGFCPILSSSNSLEMSGDEKERFRLDDELDVSSRSLVRSRLGAV